jgi:hyperosmotically inducible protein
MAVAPVHAGRLRVRFRLKTLNEERGMKTRQMLKPVNFAIAAAVALAMSTPLYAGPDASTPDPVNPAFQKLDADHDGYISHDEAAKRRNFAQAFAEADDNRDGRLDRDEFVKAEAVYDRMRTKAYIGDSVITAKVKAALVKDPEVKALEVGVKTDHGTVILSGFVDNEKQARRAQEIAISVAGVKSVKSALIVKS